MHDEDDFAALEQITTLIGRKVFAVAFRRLSFAYRRFTGGHIWLWISARPSARRVNAAANPATPELRVNTQGLPFCLQCFLSW